MTDRETAAEILANEILSESLTPSDDAGDLQEIIDRTITRIEAAFAAIRAESLDDASTACRDLIEYRDGAAKRAETDNCADEAKAHRLIGSGTRDALQAIRAMIPVRV